MNNTKQAATLFGVVLLLPMALAGCSSGASSSASSGAGKGPVTITFSSWHFAEPGRGVALQKIMDEYNASQGEVKVEAVSIPYPTYAATVLTQLGAGAGADVVNIEHAPWAAAQQKNLFSDITGKINKPKQGFVAADQSSSIKGKRYGVVYETNNYALIINQDLLDKAGLKPPTSYPEFVAAAKALTNQGNQQYGFAFRNTMSQQSGWWADLSNFVYGNGARWTDKSGTPTINTPEVIKAVKEYQEIFKSYVPQGADAATYRQMFWEGKVAMEIDNMSLPAIFLAGNPKLHLTVVPNPFPTPANAAQLEFLSVNHASKNQAAAIKFINYLMEPANQKKLSAAMSYQGVATQIDWGQQQPANMPWLKTYATVATHGVLQEPQGAETQTVAISTAVLSEVDKVLRQGKDPAAAMADAQKAVVALLKK